MTILSIVMLDDNKQITPLSWAIVVTEDYENWWLFLCQVVRYILLDKKNLVTISNYGKGLVTAVDKIYLQVVHIYCS